MHSRLLPSLLVLSVLSATASAQSFSYPDFSSVAGLNLVGLAAQSGTVLRVQDNVAPATGSDNRGAAWYASPVCVVNGFDTTFTYRMHTPTTTGGSDGLAFVIQNDQVAGSVPIVNGGPDGTGSLAIGRHAAAMGYGNFQNPPVGDTVDNSLAIELDTYNNTSPWGDADANHISVHTGGSADNGTHESFSIGRANSAALGVDLNNGASHTIRVHYVPGTLEVYLDGVLELSIAYDFTTGGTWVDSATSVGGLNLIGGTSAYVGFTSGAGTAREMRDVEAWSWDSPCGLSTFCFGDGLDPNVTTPCGALGTMGACLNYGATGNGCANSANAAGANLAASGTPNPDTIVLAGSGMPATVSCIYLQGDALDDQPFGDGVRCAGGMLIRLRTKQNVGGASTFPDSTDTVTVSQRGQVTPGSGARRYYQTYYRNAAAAFCPDQTFNVTNGVIVDW